jgi:hypothetical protein
MSPPLVPQVNQEVYFVLCDFDQHGQAYVETDPSQADRQTVIRNLIAGEYDRPISVIACNPAEGWARDVSESIAREIMRANTELATGTRPFVERLLEMISQRRALPPGRWLIGWGLPNGRR